MASALVGVLQTGCVTDEPPPESQPDDVGASWMDLAAHNFGPPIDTMWSEGELAFADDGTNATPGEHTVTSRVTDVNGNEQTFLEHNAQVPWTLVIG